jgi:2-polyprenyl-3-methyl-5-hydroxy-6-metoxy-1,4-benzoquinol methylase
MRVALSYNALVPIYDTVGMAEFARATTPRLIEYLQQRDWLGRRVIDLGCGTGAAVRWLANRGYATVAVDISNEMLDVARRALPGSGLSLNWELRDIRSLDVDIGHFDLAIAFDVLNELSSIRELEQVFIAVAKILDPQKIFAFDVRTIQGLSENGSQREVIIQDDANLMVVARNEYDHDRQIHHARFKIFQRDGEIWRKNEARRTLRGYPIQAISTLVQRCGFEVIALLTNDFATYEPTITSAQRVLVVAQRI